MFDDPAILSQKKNCVFFKDKKIQRDDEIVFLKLNICFKHFIEP